MTYQISGDCKGCGACAKKCPEHAIDGKVKVRFDINSFLCAECGTCFNTCPTGAIIDPNGKRSPKKGKKEKPAQARIQAALCAGCQNCFLNCPQGAIRVVKNILTVYCQVDAESCLGCGTCTQFCITGAVALEEPEPEERQDQHPSTDSASR
jgi:ferredoxin